MQCRMMIGKRDCIVVRGLENSDPTVGVRIGQSVDYPGAGAISMSLKVTGTNGEVWMKMNRQTALELAYAIIKRSNEEMPGEEM